MENTKEIERRWRDFTARFDQDVQLVANIHSQSGELLVPIFGWDATEALFKSAYSQASISTEGQGASAITAADSSEFPLSKLKAVPAYHFVALVHLYAYWGLESAPDGSLQWVDGVDRVIGFRETARSGWFNFLTGAGHHEALANALRAANARIIIDGIENGPITPLELAALAQIDIKTLRNSLTPSGQKKSGLRLNSEGNIIADSAKTWLLSRSRFLPTIKESTIGGASTSPKVIGREEDLLYIPVAEDGSAFSPDARGRDGKYYIETSDGETAYESYADALKTLSIMTVPSWRRSSPDGRWGMVRGNTWRRTTKTELGI